MAALPLESRFSRGRKLPRALQAWSRGGKAPIVAILTCNSKAVQGLFLPHKNTSFCYALRSRGLKVVYKNGRGGLGEGWYALRRLEQDPGLGRGHRLAGELWLSVWVSNPSDFKSIFQCLNRNWNENRVAQAQELREVCQDFLGDIGDFQKIADSFIVIFDAVSKEVETEKMKVSWIIRNSVILQYWMMRFERSHDLIMTWNQIQSKMHATNNRWGWCVNLQAKTNYLFYKSLHRQSELVTSWSFCLALHICLKIVLRLDT